MRRLIAAAVAVAESVNPIVVKELRQAVRSRLIVTILILFLLVSLAVMGLYMSAISRSPTYDESAGRDIFLTLLTILTITCLCIVPLYASTRLAMERTDTNMDLLFATAIKPSAIVRGKFWAAMAVAMLIYSCCMPFLAVTYLLKGIDLPTVFFLLAVGLAETAIAVMGGILVGSLPGGRIWRIFAGVGMLSALAGGVGASMSFAFSVVHFGLLGGGRGSFWEGFAIVMLFLAGAGGLMYVIAVAAVSPSRANRTMPIRVYLTAIWVVFAAVCLFETYRISSLDPVGAWVVFAVATFAAMLFLTVAERDSWSPRVSRTIPRNLLGRATAWLFYAGAAGGMLWCSLMAALTLLVAYGWAEYHKATFPAVSDLSEVMTCMLGLFLYGFCYCMLATLLYSVSRSRVSRAFLPLVAGLLLTAASLVPVIASITTREGTNIEDLPLAYLIAGPISLSSTRVDSKPVVWTFLLALSVLMLVLNVPWFVDQWQKFRRLQTTAPAAPK